MGTDLTFAPAFDFLIQIVVYGFAVSLVLSWMRGHR